MKHPARWSLVLTFLVASGAPVVASAQVERAAPLDAVAVERAAQFDAVRVALAAEYEAQGLVGLAVAVVRDGELAREFYFGHEDKAQDLPIDGRSMFRWASISKPVTAVAAMQLVESGKLALDRDVREYVPEFPEKPWPITARQLLCHQGGIVHYTNGEVIPTLRKYRTEHPFSDVVVALDAFKDSPLVAEPGAKHSYTTHGYMLLGAVVQRAGEASFAEQVRARIAAPLGMTTFQPDYQWVDIPHRAVGYRRVGKLVVPTTDTDVSWKLPGGGYISTIGDLARFAAGLLQDKVLPREAREVMWTRQKTSDDKVTGYGLGFGVSSVDRQRRISHSGSQEKTRTLMQLAPDVDGGQGAAVVLMTNSEWAKLDRCADAVWAVLNGG